MKIGFIGAGNMGGAIINGILHQNAFPADDIYISRKHPEYSAEWAAQGVHIVSDNKTLARTCECIILAIKPIHVRSVIQETYDFLKGKLIISIAAGWTYEMLKDELPDSARFVRVMPNTPLTVGEGMSLFSDLYTCTEEELAYAQSIFEAAGKTAIVEDSIFEAATGISGCGPAFVFAFIEALADGGVRCGVPRQLAYQLAAQTLVGAGKMVLETGKHPGELKDSVCSPGGTTIEGICALESGGMRSAVIEAVTATVEKTNHLKR